MKDDDYPMIKSVLLQVALLSIITSVGVDAQVKSSTSMIAKPNIDSEIIDSQIVYTVHLRPLYTTTIHLPETVTSIAVGAPTLFEAEHNGDEPRLVFVKPSTHDAAESNLLIALSSGRTISLTLISAGDAGSPVPVDYVVDYSNPGSMLKTNYDAIAPSGGSQESPAGTVVGGGVTVYGTGESPSQVKSVSGGSMDSGESQGFVKVALNRQINIAAPTYISGEELKKQIFPDKISSRSLRASLGELTQQGDMMTLSYSIINSSDHWIEVLPPQIQLLNPKAKKRNKKKPQSLSEQIPIESFKMTSSKLAPGQRLDAAVVFARPDFKQTRDMLVLQIAISSAVDTPLLLPISFVAPGN